MKRYIGPPVVTLAFLFVLLVVIVSACSVLQPPKQSEWRNYHRRTSNGDSYTTYELRKGLNDREEIACEVTVPFFFFSVDFDRAVYLYAAHSNYMKVKAGRYHTWASEDMKISPVSGAITRRDVDSKKDYIPPVNAYSFNGKYSLFFTFCFPLKDGLPKEVSALIKKPAP